MLKSAKNLEGLAIKAQDGVIGKVHDWLFDERNWEIRYLVVDTEKWLPGRRVLLPSSSAGPMDPRTQGIPVNLTQREIKEGPSIAEDEPLSLEMEKMLNERYGWPMFGGGGSIVQPAEERKHSIQKTLRSVREVVGYELRGIDGELGTVHDFLLDDTTWTLQEIVVDTRKWLPGKKVLTPPQLVEGMSWTEKTVRVDLFRANIASQPEYDPSSPPERVL